MQEVSIILLGNIVFFFEMLFGVGRPQLRQVGELMNRIDSDR